MGHRPLDFLWATEVAQCGKRWALFGVAFLYCPAGAAQGQVVGSSAIRISWGRSSTASRGPAAIAAAAAALGAPAYPYPSVGVVPAAPRMPSFCQSGPY